jgi:hypothetical protein
MISFKRQLRIQQEGLVWQAIQHQKAYNDKRKQYESKGRKQHNFKKGDLVWHNVANHFVGTQRKLRPTYNGPYEILDLPGPVTANIQNPNNGKWQIVNVRTLKLKPKILTLTKRTNINPTKDLLEDISWYLNQLHYKGKETHVTKYATPLPVCEYLCKRISIMARYLKTLDVHQIRILDLMAGAGDLTGPLYEQFLTTGQKPLQGKFVSITCVEKDKDRLQIGKQKYPNTKWIQSDIFDESFLQSEVTNGSAVKNDIIVTNCDFKLAYPTLLLASEMLQPNGRIFALLPSDFWDGSNRRMDLYPSLRLNICEEHKLGRWNYLPDTKKCKQKRSTDSWYILKKLGTNEHHNYISKTFRPRLAKYLVC